MRDLTSSALARDDKPFVVFYFLFLLAYFVNFDRDQQYVVYGLLLLCSLPSVRASRQAFLLSAPLLWSSVLLLYLTVSFAWSDYSEPVYFVEIVSKAALTASFLFVTAYLVWKKPLEFSRVLAAMIVCVALVGLLSIFLFYAENPFPTARLVSFGQLNNPGYMGSVNGVFAVIAGYFAIVAQNTRARLGYTLTFIVLLAVVMMAQARSAFIAMVAAILVLVIWQGRSRSVRYSMIASTLIGLYVFGKPVFTRFLTAGVDVSSDLRLQIWQDALPQILTHPFMGAGIGTKMQFVTSEGVFTHPHSVYISVTWYGGVLGLFLLLGMLATAYRECILVGRQKGNYLALALLVYTTFCVLVDYSEIMTFPRDIWVQFWLAIAVAGGVAIGRRLDHHSAGQP